MCASGSDTIRTTRASEGQVSARLDLDHREEKFSLLLPPVQMDGIRGSFPQQAKTQGRGTGKGHVQTNLSTKLRVSEHAGGHTPPTGGRESNRGVEEPSTLRSHLAVAPEGALRGQVVRRVHKEKVFP